MRIYLYVGRKLQNEGQVHLGGSRARLLARAREKKRERDRARG